LALFDRRPPKRVVRSSLPAVKNLQLLASEQPQPAKAEESDEQSVLPDRRPPKRVVRSSLPAVKNLHMSGHP